MVVKDAVSQKFRDQVTVRFNFICLFANGFILMCSYNVLFYLKLMSFVIIAFLYHPAIGDLITVGIGE